MKPLVRIGALVAGIALLAAARGSAFRFRRFSPNPCIAPGSLNLLALCFVFGALALSYDHHLRICRIAFVRTCALFCDRRLCGRNRARPIGTSGCYRTIGVTLVVSHRAPG